MQALPCVTKKKDIKRTRECNSQIYEQIHISVPHFLQHLHISLLIHLVLFASCLLSSGETVSVSDT